MFHNIDEVLLTLESYQGQREQIRKELGELKEHSLKNHKKLIEKEDELIEVKRKMNDIYSFLEESTKFSGKDLAPFLKELLETRDSKEYEIINLKDKIETAKREDALFKTEEKESDIYIVSPTEKAEVIKGKLNEKSIKEVAEELPVDSYFLIGENNYTLLDGDTLNSQFFLIPELKDMALSLADMRLDVEYQPFEKGRINGNTAYDDSLERARFSDKERLEVILNEYKGKKQK